MCGHRNRIYGVVCRLAKGLPYAPCPEKSQDMPYIIFKFVTSVWQLKNRGIFYPVLFLWIRRGDCYGFSTLRLSETGRLKSEK